MIRHSFSELIEQAESVLRTIDCWEGTNGISNRIDFIDGFLREMDGRKEILIQLDKAGNNMHVFKAFLSPEDTAAYLGVHRSTISKIVMIHGLTPCNFPFTKMLIVTEELVEWCRQYPDGETGVSATGCIQKKKGSKK